MRFYYVFYVFHQYLVEYDTDGNPVNENKEIGVYTKRELANNAVNRFIVLPGFKDYPNGFHVCKRRCYYSNTNRRLSCCSIVSVFSPYHEYYIPQENCDVVTRGAFYEEKEAAEKIVDEWKNGTVLKKYPDGFSVVEYKLNEDIRFWNEGFC